MNHARRHPDFWAKTRAAVQQYEKPLLGCCSTVACTTTGSGTRGQLAVALVHLRRLALPGAGDFEEWYAWPAIDPSKALRVYLDSDDVDSIQTAYYGTLSGFIDDEDCGIPKDEPVWLTDITPRIVWERVAPSVALAEATRARELGHAVHVRVDLSEWAMSDRWPSGLARARPTAANPYRGGNWSW